MKSNQPVLLAVPRENLAAKTVIESGTGLVVEPGDISGFLTAAQRLIDSAQLRTEFGQAARRYAETHFDIRHIGDQFESILQNAGSVVPARTHRTG
jgi:glycosyltransferase involved in cell wall biosynthesis